MTLQEVIEKQAEIIDLQNKLVLTLAAGLNIDLAYNEEMARIEELKKKLGVK